MNTENKWIKMSERKLPQGEPAFVYYIGGNMDFIKNPVGEYSCSHWMPATMPPPPAKEETQREQDKAAFRAWAKDSWTLNTGYDEGWHAALAHERAWFRAELEKISGATFQGPVGAIIHAMRERCKETS